MSENSKISLSIFNPSYMIATCFGIGKTPFMPGTVGSLLAYPIYYFQIECASLYKSVNLIFIFLLTFIILFFLGWWASSNYSDKTMQEDPKEIVIDEVIGQLLTLNLSSWIFILIFEQKNTFENSRLTIFKYFMLVFPFIIFRLCDIFKPSLIGWCDKNIKSGLGVIMDDVVAGLFAGITYNIIFIIGIIGANYLT